MEGETQPPRLMWQRDFNRLGPKTFTNIHTVEKCNVVMHISPKLNTIDKRERLMFGESLTKLLDDKKEEDAMVKFVSNTNPSNPFSHLSLNINGFPGKLLVFKKWNMIRNGKYSQSEHFSLVVRYLRSRNRPFYGGIAIPNNVMVARFKDPIGECIKQDPRAVHTKKFPGISIITARKKEGRTRCTSSIYPGYTKATKQQKRSSVVFAGTHSAEDLMYHLKMVDELSIKYPSTHKLTVFDDEEIEVDDDVE